MKHFPNRCLFLPDLASTQSSATKSFRSYRFSFTFNLFISVSSLYRTLNTGSNTEVFAFQITTLSNQRQRDWIVSIKKNCIQITSVHHSSAWKTKKSMNQEMQQKLCLTLNKWKCPITSSLGLAKYVSGRSRAAGAFSETDKMRSPHSRNRSPLFVFLF